MRVVSLALLAIAVLVLGALPVPAVGAASLSAPTSPLPRIPVVAAENFYGDIVNHLAGDRVSIISIMSDPNVDPHAYETNAKDAAAVADARLVIQTGLGYDAFIDHLLAASPNPHRTVIVVAALTGHKEGDNPHLWYAPSTMPKVAQAVVDALSQADPQNAAFYQARHRVFQESLRPLTRTVARLHDRHLGAPIAVTEPVFNYMAGALGLHVLTPEAFQKAIEDGVDPPTAALAQMEDQLKKRQVRVLVYNTQTVSAVTRRLRQLADQLGIPVVGVSETEPSGKSYLRWMVGQLEQLDAALSKQK